MPFFEYLGSLTTLWISLLQIFLSVVAGGIIGLERGKHGRAAGMRTHILVCLGATLTAMTGMYAASVLGMGDPLRIAAQVISGIGFLGVGTILIKGRFQITGLTTAAGLWTVAAIGIAIGIGFYEGAAIAFIAVILASTVLHRLDTRITRRNTRFGIYVEISSDGSVRKILNHLYDTYPITDLQVTPPRSGKSGNVGIEANVHAYKRHDLTPASITNELERLEEVVFAIESL